MMSCFTCVLHVPNLSQPDHLIAVLEESGVFTKDDIAKIARRIQGQRSVPARIKLTNEVHPRMLG